MFADVTLHEMRSPLWKAAVPGMQLVLCEWNLLYHTLFISSYFL